MKNKKITAVQRHDEIAKFLTAHETISVNEIAEMYQVTKETARKDLLELERQGIVNRFHGGAKIINEYKNEPVLQERSMLDIDKKHKIALKAQGFIQNNSTIILDAGSTTYAIAELLDPALNLTVITNSIPVVTLLAQKGIKCLMIGGEVFGSDLSTAGIWVESCMKNIYADIAFIGSTGIMNPAGPSVENFVSANSKVMMLSKAEKKYIVADSGKTLVSALVQFAEWEDVDGLIVDDEIPDSAIDKLKERARLILAE